ncbi:hypothetical protein M0R04_04945 [Candidatus Dojkabacteria bacterium]|jgi:hypothetical protein|nr:hypothetical protein [Candidatus Dojkabacteria bacterium]
MNRRIEEHFGRKIVCGKMFNYHEIIIGSKWQSSSGSIVEVIDVKKFIWLFQDKEQIEYVVFYKWQEDGKEKKHDKDSFNFQCRYCLIVE